MTTLVTGASGFVGRYAVRELVSAGAEVVALDHAPAAGLPRSPRLSAVQGDVRDLRQLARVAREHRVDRIIHLASLLAPASQDDPYHALEVNVIGTQNLMEVALLCGVTNFTWASSMAVFGHQTQADDDSEEFTESSRHCPDNVYGTTKSYAEGISLAYRERYGLNTVGLRIGLVYGQGKERGEGLFTEHLFDRPARGEDAVVPFGDDVFSWQYVRDVARAFILVNGRDETDQGIYNLPGTVASMREAVDLVRELRPEATIGTEPGRLGFPYRFSVTAFEKLAGDEHRLTPLRDGFAETLDRLRDGGGE
ncbi:NAD-dependent epimerase/dehydratase family protein [Actinomadura chibensis]|uniref:NAD(P)-dependent oxidoreductase n=1 Tax=Actinomadura chibensis TaxID=392828 RepID=A0A5D0NQ29_9ACTN|nr:NAD(P)-dependent oxidoreductase [Actinomadura chibensis]TYB46304.1 NAD(P)-dependent oxidoreductase [Actinomadura chibensis]